MTLEIFFFVLFFSSFNLCLVLAKNILFCYSVYPGKIIIDFIFIFLALCAASHCTHMAFVSYLHCHCIYARRPALFSLSPVPLRTVPVLASLPVPYRCWFGGLPITETGVTSFSILCCNMRQSGQIKDRESLPSKIPNGDLSGVPRHRCRCGSKQAIPKLPA